jgi:valyl-tRNA synthetase
VLDTWFSSALWPFSTVGWPDETPALKRFYPASDLETGYDILFFWVARMMMMGIHFMGEPPFKRILLHGLVVDETGDKMSKVKGNVIDPLDLIHGSSFDDVVDKALPGAPKDEALKKFKKAYPSAAGMGSGFAAYGADALRFTLVTYSPQAKRIPLSLKKIEGNRNFVNKIWNATRYALTHVEGVAWRVPEPKLVHNRWILSRLGGAIDAARKAIDDFRLDDASLGLYHFFWGELCDWYVEITKPALNFGSDSPERTETREVLAFVLENVMRALHPFVPFITEELWQRLPRPEGAPKSIVVAAWPEIAFRDAEAEKTLETVMAIVGAARTIRSEHEVHPGAEVPLELRTSDEAMRRMLSDQLATIGVLVKTKGAPVVAPRDGGRPKGAVMSIAAGVEVLVSLVGLVDGKKELERIEREIKKTEKDIAAIEKKLSLPSFAEKAPPEVVAEARAQLEELRAKRAGLEEAKAIAKELD